MNNDIKLNGNAVIVEGSLGSAPPTRLARCTWKTELHSGGGLLLGSGEHPMTVENESSNETPEGEGEAGSLVQKEPDVEGVACGAGTEEKKLRIVLQVEVQAGIDDDGKKLLTDVNKISVVSEHIRAVVHVIGGSAD